MRDTTWLGMVFLGIAVVLASGCSHPVDTSRDIGSAQAQAAPAESLTGSAVALPAVVVDSRGFRQIWGAAQSSLELSDYAATLDETAQAIDETMRGSVAWTRLADRLRSEAHAKVFDLTTSGKGVSHEKSALLRVAAAQGFEPAYLSTYKEKHEAEYNKNVREIPLPTLYDALIEGIKSGALKGKLDAVGVKESEIPMHLVRKASSARADQRCGLDPRETQDREPTKLELLWGYVASDCYARKVMYRAVKGKLIQAKKSPAVQKLLGEEFDRQFPPKFHEGFNEGFSQAIHGAHKLLLDKVEAPFGHDVFPSFTYLENYWGAEPAPEDGAAVHVNLEQLGLTLAAQSQGAAELLDTSRRDERAYGLVSAYGALEKMLYVLGQNGAAFDARGRVKELPQADEDLRRGAAPRLALESIGGAAFDLKSQKLVAWDPDADIKGDAATKLYPRWLSMDSAGRLAAGQPVVSDLDTLVALAQGALTFLELEHSTRRLALGFGPASQVLDAQAKGALFAQELKDLPLGILATALKTIVAEHLLALDVDGHALPTRDAPGLAGLALRARGGRSHVINARSTARAVLVLARLARALDRGGALENRKDLAEVKKQLDLALPLVLLNLGKCLQDGDGGFEAEYDVDAQRTISTGPRSFAVQAVVLQAHLEVYRLYGTLALGSRALKILSFLKSPAMWSAQARFFRSSENATESQFAAADLLRLLEASLKLNADLGVSEANTQTQALARRLAELLQSAGLGKQFETLGLLTP